MNEFYEKMDDATRSIADILKNILLDVELGLNLQKHLDEINSAISELDKKINSAKQAGTPHVGLDKLKNELHRIRYEILEQL